MAEVTIKTNRLISEKSPYLLQHADNPVDWFPWSEEAFEKALREDKPVFVSIGYSTCHWCHVMEHESFENQEIAALMNDRIVCVKVDREEMPALDHFYMNICQLTTGSGGWPLSIFMTPEKQVFFTGTYFPPYTVHNRIGFGELVVSISEAWKQKREDLLKNSQEILDLVVGDQVNEHEELGHEEIEAGFRYLLNNYDNVNGGFGSAPKFPSVHNLLFLLRYWKKSKNSQALDMVVKTLKELRKGGIFDQLGFGLHRYSTDRYWLVPHFEKMLYDQAMAVMSYLEAFQATGKVEFARISEEIFEYLLRDMLSPEGGFYSAEDADVDEEEGKFYLWNIYELRQILTEEELKLFGETFNIKKEGNFSAETGGHVNGENILHLGNLFHSKEASESDVESRIRNIIQKVLKVRNKRTLPMKDDKILMDWNSLVIAALAKGARILKRGDLLQTAETAANFILTKMVDETGCFYHRYRDFEKAYPANLDDYAYFISGLLELYESSLNEYYLKKACELQELLFDQFWDKENYGFYFSSSKNSLLNIRTKEVYDGALPSGNSVSLMNLLKLKNITNRPIYGAYLTNLMRAFGEKVKKSPHAHTAFLSAVLSSTDQSQELIVVDNKLDKENRVLQRIYSAYFPNLTVIYINQANNDSFLLETADYLKGYTRLKDQTTYYVCTNRTCLLPTEDSEAVLKLLF